jgi:chemotaxis protein histidine kinase CheA
VQLHDGSIDFETEVGHGTTFRVELPLARPLEPVLVPSSETSDTVGRKS